MDANKINMSRTDQDLPTLVEVLAQMQAIAMQKTAILPSLKIFEMTFH